MNTNKMAFFAFCLLLNACQGLGPGIFGGGDDEPGTGLDTFDPSIVNDPLSEFSWEIFQKTIAEQEDLSENLMISPLSIASALYMAYNGADGTTRREMEATLRLSNLSPEVLNGSFTALVSLLEEPILGSRLRAANSFFWDESRLDVDPEFLQDLEQYYRAELGKDNFRQNKQQVLDNINDWVSDATEGRIDKILDNIKDEEVAFLINALYYLGDWLQPFDPDLTVDAPFTLSGGQTVDVPILFQDSAFPNYRGDDYTAVECTMADSSYAMWFVLPPEEEQIDQWIASFSIEELKDNFASTARRERILLRLPKFELKDDIELSAILKALGMPAAFNPFEADFSKLGSSQTGNNIYISQVRHKTFFQLDEKGVEGAAVTSIGFGVTSLPPTISFTRPFLALLMHKPTGTLVFAGKVKDPSRD